MEFIKVLPVSSGVKSYIIRSVYTRIYMSLYGDPACFYDAVMMFPYTPSCMRFSSV